MSIHFTKKFLFSFMLSFITIFYNIYYIYKMNHNHVLIQDDKIVQLKVYLYLIIISGTTFFLLYNFFEKNSITIILFFHTCMSSAK